MRARASRRLVVRSRRARRTARRAAPARLPADASSCRSRRRGDDRDALHGAAVSLVSGHVSPHRIAPCASSTTSTRTPPAGRELLGGKGVGLAEMTALGVPVPAGFTITTDACRAYMAAGEVPEGLDGRWTSTSAALEQHAGKRFGDPVRPAARLGALRCGRLDARDDGHDPQPRASTTWRSRASRPRPATRGSPTTRTGA